MNNGANSVIHIAFVLESLGAGGSERQLVELIKNLNREQFKVRVLTYIMDDFFRPELDRLGVSVRCLVRKGKWDLRAAFELARWLRSGEVDLVHAYSPTGNFYAVLAGKMARRGKVVASERCLLLRYLTGLMNIHGPWAYRNADLTIANSSSARSSLIEHLHLASDQVLFIPNGLDFEKFKPLNQEIRSALRKRLGWSGSHRIILTVASFKPQKNHQGILDAVEGDETGRSRLQFYWAGVLAPADEFSRVKERIALLHLTDLIHILGERDDVADLYRACDVLVLSSLWEGTPNVVLEAMACGRPVIATDVSDVSRYVLPGQTGWLVAPGDAEALRQALHEAAQIGDEELEQMGARGRQHLLNLGIDSTTMAHRHEQVYFKLLNSRVAPASES